MRAELLPALPSGRASSGAGGHVDEPCGVPLRCSPDRSVTVNDANPEQLGLLPRVVLVLGGKKDGVVWEQGEIRMRKRDPHFSLAPDGRSLVVKIEWVR